ncbi:kinase-like domain-containing protein [Cunninghamella echinulata]|nr:kinase-like domain-containing protein [Cunninghamella echinulata]
MLIKCCCSLDQSIPEEHHPLEKFNILKTIGNGSYGLVKLIQHKKTKNQYALKIINKDMIITRKKQTIDYILSERYIMTQISYPLIVNLRYSFQDNDDLFMVLDYMENGDLRQWIKKNNTHNPSLFLFDEDCVRYLIAEIILSIHYLHQHRICHRDIKPENILLDAKGHAHLSDFTIATILNQPLQWSKAGSLAYMAPEIIGNQGYTTFIDWWSLGIVTFELLFGKRPFTAPSNELLVHSILYEPFTFPKEAYGKISSHCLHFITSLLQKSPTQRLNNSNIFNHPWFEGINWQQLEQKKNVTPMHTLIKNASQLSSPSSPHSNLSSTTNTLTSLDQSLMNKLSSLSSSSSSSKRSSYNSSKRSSYASSKRSSYASSKRSSYQPSENMDSSNNDNNIINDIDRSVTEQAQLRDWLEEAYLDYDYLNSPNGITSSSSSKSFIKSIFCCF